ARCVNIDIAQIATASDKMHEAHIGWHAFIPEIDIVVIRQQQSIRLVGNDKIGCYLLASPAGPAFIPQQTRRLARESFCERPHETASASARPPSARANPAKPEHPRTYCGLASIGSDTRSSTHSIAPWTCAAGLCR